MRIDDLLKRVLLQVGLGLGVSSAPLLAAAPLDETVSTLEQWVETERLISRAQAEWETNRASMENLLEVYGQEIETLEALIQAAEEDTSAAEARRSELTEQDRAIKEIEAQVIDGLIEAEKALKGLKVLLPPPLQQELGPLFNTLPDNPEESRLALGQRIQPIVAILTQVQKFNQVVTVVEGFREFEEGRTVQTEKIHFGLGAAFYIDQADEHAGVAVLGPDGWEWRDDNSLIPAVRSFIDIYRGTQQARYVDLPIAVD
jgi:hypothetical protein